MIYDIYASRNVELHSPAGRHVKVVPSDTVDFEYHPRAIYVESGGDVAIVDEEGNVEVYAGLPTHTTLTFRARRINATGTTATNIKAWW